MGENTIFDEIREENTKEITTKIATKMKNLDMNKEIINQCTGLSFDEIEKL